VPLAKLAARDMVGEKLVDLGFTHEIIPPHMGVKEAVFPFAKFPGVDTLLGPEMKSTGEVMGIDASFGFAFAKAQLGAGTILPLSGTVFVSVQDADKAALVPIAQRLVRSGLKLVATEGTAAHSARRGAGRGHQQGAGFAHAVDAILRRQGPVGDEHSCWQRCAPDRSAAPYRAGVPRAVLHHHRSRRRRDREFAARSHRALAGVPRAYAQIDVPLLVFRALQFRSSLQPLGGRPG
jgi:hypothetical protein